MIVIVLSFYNMTANIDKNPETAKRFGIFKQYLKVRIYLITTLSYAHLITTFLPFLI